MATNQGKPYPEFLADMADTIADFMQDKCEIPQEKATDLAFKVTEMLRHTYGGEMLYFPKFIHIELSMRDLEILRKCKTMPYAEVAKEYGISTRRIYQIIYQAKFGTQGVQPFLPLGEDEAPMTAAESGPNRIEVSHGRDQQKRRREAGTKRDLAAAEPGDPGGLRREAAR